MFQMTAHLSFVCCDYPGDLVRGRETVILVSSAVSSVVRSSED
jgi:hypothetical protein